MTLGDAGKRFSGLPSGIHTVLTSVIGATIIGLGSWMWSANADLARVNQTIADADFRSVRDNQERAFRELGDLKTGVATILQKIVDSDKTMEQGRDERLEFERAISKRLDDLQGGGRERPMGHP
jgi:hypothetical protein